MPYRTNYEPYTSQSFEMKRELSTEEILYPLGTLYPHVVALQLQTDEYPWCKANHYAGYDSSLSVDEASEHYSTKSMLRRNSGMCTCPSSVASDFKSNQSDLSDKVHMSHANVCADSTACRIVSRIRRLLNRDELRRRRQA
ncbi:hypothetical protein AAWM_00917 [Aspergillus awamori]|uniref:Uncharacterized protein n=5 Tax=Aspergillus TaxID=5052 RepID=A0A401KFQ2_ASPAW|nr:uncharacterized protein BO96DRAFT_442370 [Aspergillus niger CBS 101883]EHA23485.1 hypothetical protein ASPNIDRAFT_37485 [Aspergillus niger ATCC 1015]RDH23266.1 hypothetical protein M747DRAFT_166042 [Aspergillus niger ATCC 13496]RDK44793.1 hypothetical protein M752DRAFT_263634 [Aspergillus phoenicis ATCC 13157]TPR08573.1 RNA recognition motif family protein [Aspergillus niger]GCB18032.1 hypothetical protein AAWM_00917 [Aspergillus awamori]